MLPGNHGYCGLVYGMRADSESLNATLEQVFRTQSRTSPPHGSTAAVVICPGLAAARPER